MSDPVSQEDFRRLETKVDKLTDAIQRLILIEERQSSQGERLSKCETKIAIQENSLIKTEKKVDQWVNRGIGVWVSAAVLFSILQFGAKFL